MSPAVLWANKGQRSEHHDRGLCLEISNLLLALLNASANNSEVVDRNHVQHAAKEAALKTDCNVAHQSRRSGQLERPLAKEAVFSG